MKKLIILTLTISILTACGNSEADKQKSAKLKSQQLLPTSADKISILDAKVVSTHRSPYIYNWGLSDNFIVLKPLISYKGPFNEDELVIKYETHWKQDSIHGQTDTDTLPFLKDKVYQLQLDLTSVDSGRYADTAHFMYLYKLIKFTGKEKTNQ